MLEYGEEGIRKRCLKVTPFFKDINSNGLSKLSVVPGFYIGLITLSSTTSSTLKYLVTSALPGLAFFYLSLIKKQMRPTPISAKILISFSCFLTIAYAATAQDLDPRAYVKAPVKGTFLIGGYAHSEGGVLTDPTLPLENLRATVNIASVGVARTFSLFGRSTQALVVLPYGWIDATALVNGQRESASRSGFSDMRVRLSMLLLGGKAVTFQDYAKENSRTFIGTSLTVIAPTGQYFTDKLINLGTRRWSFKPEVALAQKIGKRWMLDFYTGVWLFTTNETFYPGSAVRTQDPLVSFQSHISYNINPRAWVAFDATFYTGGQSSVNDTYKDDRQSNARLGATLALPVGKRSALKIAYSRGAVIRVGADFSTVSIGWTSTWFAK